MAKRKKKNKLVKPTEQAATSFENTEQGESSFENTEQGESSFENTEQGESSFENTEQDATSFENTEQDATSFETTEQGETSFENTEQDESSFENTEQGESPFETTEQGESSFENTEQDESSFENTEQNESSFETTEQDESSFETTEQGETSFENTEQDATSFENTEQNESSFETTEQGESSFETTEQGESPFETTEQGESSFETTEQGESPFETTEQGESSFENTEQDESSFENTEQDESSFENTEQNESSFETTEQDESSFETTEQGESSFETTEQGESSFETTEQGESSFETTEQGESSFETTEQGALSTSPAISVIIPLYNAEEYLVECLDSVLAQTFQNFELIIVDDCSTDSSCEIVESYMPKFNGRLKLYHTPKNTGSGVIARNIGFGYSCGEYIYNMDNDDVITKTALEEMYSLAKEYDADVVYCERYYMSTGVGEEFIKNVYLARGKIQKPPYVDKPTLESPELSERVKSILNDKLWFAPWLKLIRRDLLDKHKIFFPVLKIGDDDIWTYAIVFFAKNFLRVPNRVYIRRMREDSITGIEKTPQQTLKFWFNPILLGVKELDSFMERLEFFKENPQQRYDVLEKFFHGKLIKSFNEAEELMPSDIYETIKNEFGEKLGEYDVSTSALCTYIFKLIQKDKQRDIELEDKLILQNEKKFDFMPKISFPQIIFPAPLSFAISVVIPMYNAAENVEECLESLLIQTFQDFEIIVVDDCSTDNSVEIVESYAPKFNGRLKLVKLEKNSGTGGYVPRNNGLYLASGEYVFFMDADDFILNTALETLYNSAKEYDADMVYMAPHYEMNKPNTVNVVTDGRGKGLKDKGVEDNPTLTIDEPNKNLHLLLFEQGFTTPWSHFSKREFLIKNHLVFPEIPKAGDYIWVIHSYCYSKRFLRITTPLYFYRRYGTTSVSKSTASDQFFNWISSFVIFAKALTYLKNKTRILKKDPLYCYFALKKFFDWCLNRTDDTRKSWESQRIYKILYNEFSAEDNLLELTLPFLFSMVDNEQKLGTIYKVPPSVLPFISARIDVVLQSEKDFSVFSVSDKSAKVSKPRFLQRDGVGRMINSYSGRVEIFIKADTDGQAFLLLKSMDIRDPKDNSKRIPHWIDYTKLIVNKKLVFNKPNPAWCNKPYRYKLKLQAGSEVKLQIEWLPHRSDYSEPKVMPAPRKSKDPIPAKFRPFITARIDAKFVSKVTGGDFKILSMSDDKANVLKPEWFQKSGIGYVITSFSGELAFRAKATTDGQIVLNLRGLDVRHSDDWAKGVTKRIAYWIDYTNFTINENTIFNTITPVCCDKPYTCRFKVKAEEEVTVKVVWMPHKSKN